MVRIPFLFSAALLGVTISGSTVAQDYTIPDDLTPLTTWRDGYSAADTMRFRREYDDDTLTGGADDGAYAIKHISEVLPAAIVHRYGPVSELAYSLMPEIGDVTATTDLGTMTLNEMLADPRSRLEAIAVVHEGEIVFEKYISMRDWDNHIWASATKSVVGLIASQLEDEGRLDLTLPVAHYLPDFAGTAWADVPVSEVLHQRSGLDIREASLGDPDNPITLFYAIFAGASVVPEGMGFRDAMKLAERLREPGIDFDYSSMNTMMMAFIAEELTGKPFDDLITERVWAKLGTEGDAVLGLSASGEPSAFGIFGSRLRDLARYAIAYTPSWNVAADERVVAEDYLDRVYAAAPVNFVAGYDGSMGARLVNDFGDLEMGASYQWDAVFPDGDLYKSGRGGQCIYVSPETDTAVVYFSASYQSSLWVHAYAREIVTQVFRN